MPAAAVDEVLELLRAVGTLRMLQRLQRLGGELFHALLRLVAVGPLELLCLAAQLLLRPRHRPRPEPAVLQRGEQRAAHGAAFDQAVRPVAAQLIVHLSDVLGEIEADAAAGEHYEWTQMYADFAKVAREEGFTAIATAFELVAKIESFHEQRYLKLRENIETGKVFKRGAGTVWICLNCGHIHYGKTAPDVCPVCDHPKAYFAQRVKNY